jgi:hypothetical protein
MEKPREHILDAALVGFDLLDREEPAALIAPGWIADPRGAAAHKRNRFLSGLLSPVEQHDLDERTDMKRGRGAIEADITDDAFLRGKRIQSLVVRTLMDEAALRQNVEEFGRKLAHRRALCQQWPGS